MTEYQWRLEVVNHGEVEIVLARQGQDSVTGIDAVARRVRTQEQNGEIIYIRGICTVKVTPGLPGSESLLISIKEGSTGRYDFTLQCVSGEALRMEIGKKLDIIFTAVGKKGTPQSVEFQVPGHYPLVQRTTEPLIIPHCHTNIPHFSFLLPPYLNIKVLSVCRLLTQGRVKRPFKKSSYTRIGNTIHSRPSYETHADHADTLD